MLWPTAYVPCKDWLDWCLLVVDRLLGSSGSFLARCSYCILAQLFQMFSQCGNGIRACLIFYMALLQRLILQKAFSSQQLVHITVINLFELHHLRDFSNETDDQSFSSDEQISWIQLLGLFSKCFSIALQVCVESMCTLIYRLFWSLDQLADILEPSSI